MNICCHRYKEDPLLIQVASITLVQLDLGIAEKPTECVAVLRITQVLCLSWTSGAAPDFLDDKTACDDHPKGHVTPW